MLILTIVLSAVFLSAIIFYFIYKGFKNPKIEHQDLPKDFGAQIHEVSFPSILGKPIYGWKIEINPNNPTLILVHGWGRNVERMSPYIRKLCCHGFNMLAFDARGHGNSHEDGYMTIVKFAEDIASATNFVLEDKKLINKDIYLIGLSIGGASSILAASRDSRIKKVVTVGAFAHPLDVMRKQLSDRYVPYYPFTWLFFKFIKWKIKIDFNDIAPVNVISRSKAEFLLIHGINDKVVPIEQGRRLKEVHPAIELWEIPGRGHSNCHVEPGFWEKVTGFLTK